MSAAARLTALDVFRGATIAGMILVNNPGGGKTFAPLLHAEWHGCTPTDLIFPFFLFIVGVAIPFAFASRLARSGGDRWPLYRQIARRVVILFALGLFLNWFRLTSIDWSTVRIPGVLQRIAVVYGLAALAYLWLSPRWRGWLTAALLVGYAWLLAGDLSPQGNLPFAIDHAVLGNHTWRLSPGPGDPEGLLSTLGALATALLGLFAGDWLRTERTAHEKLTGLFVWGSTGMLAGWAWAPFLPWNKMLWTSSYVLWTGGLAAVGLGLTMYWVDVRGKTAWARPFEIFGTNAVAAFFGSTLMAKLGYQIQWVTDAGESTTLQRFLFTRLVDPLLPDYWASLVWALAYVLLWLGLMGVMWRRRWFWRV